MANIRAHFSKSGPELQAFFVAADGNVRLLQELLNELKHRGTPTAATLRKKVEAAVAAASSGNGTAKAATPTPDYPSSATSPQTISCRGCSTTLRVAIRAERSAYSCPSCKTDFEADFKNGVFQVIWVEIKDSPEEIVQTMTDGGARAILGISATAGFFEIKTAWRKASQQYHPDKHQALPERLRFAAEFEMKRINCAYRFLEGRTAADF
jgi:hypothetical protein